MQLNGNMSLSEIEAVKQEEEKPRRISLWMKTVDVSMGEVRETFREHGIEEFDYFGDASSSMSSNQHDF